MDIQKQRLEISIASLISHQCNLRVQLDLDIEHENFNIKVEEGGIELLSHKAEVTNNQEDFVSFNNDIEFAILAINQHMHNIEVLKSEYRIDSENLRLDILELADELATL